MLTIHVIVADDHPVMRSGLRDMLNAQADIEVVAAAANGEEALRLTRRKMPDVLLLDMEMPDLSGVEVARQLMAEQVPVRILALSAYDDKAYVKGLLESGAAGYITKEKPLPMIAEAVRAVARGEGRWFVQPSRSTRSEGEDLLSERQLEVLRLMAKGDSNQEIAEQLNIAENTVRNHVSGIYDKLDVASWRKAIAWAWQHDLMEEP